MSRARTVVDGAAELGLLEVVSSGPAGERTFQVTERALLALLIATATVTMEDAGDGDDAAIILERARQAVSASRSREAFTWGPGSFDIPSAEGAAPMPARPLTVAESANLAIATARAPARRPIPSTSGARDPHRHFFGARVAGVLEVPVRHLREAKTEREIAQARELAAAFILDFATWLEEASR